MGACLVGWAHSRFGRLDGPDLEALIGSVARVGDASYVKEEAARG
jgi:hypothetical protein